MSIKPLKFLPLGRGGLTGFGRSHNGQADGDDIPPIHTVMTQAQVEKLYGEPSA
jgi:hypothetical protein